MARWRAIRCWRGWDGTARGQHGRGMRQRPILMAVNITPNHHEMATRWAFSDNFYADSEVSVDGTTGWPVRNPNAWTESSLMAAYGKQKDFRLPTSAPGRCCSPRHMPACIRRSNWRRGDLAPTRAPRDYVPELRGRLRTGRHGRERGPQADRRALSHQRADARSAIPEHVAGVSVFNLNIPDQYRASQFIAEVERKYVQGGEAFPRFVFLHLPADHMMKARPEDGYPYEASYVADNDWRWADCRVSLKKSVVAGDGDLRHGGRRAGRVDHVDSHRTVLLVAARMRGRITFRT